MPLLIATFLGSIFGSLFEFLAKFLTKKLAITLAAVAVILGLTTAYFALLVGLMNIIIPVLPSEILLGMGHLFPNNWQVLTSTLVAAHTAKFAYNWNLKVAQMKLS